MHARRYSGFHIPGTERGGRAAKRGTQVGPSGNVNCKNNSSDCNQLRVSLQHPLESLGQPARQSSSQEERQTGAMVGKYSIPSLARGWRPALLCFPGAPSQRAYLCHTSLSKKHCSPESTNQHASDQPPPKIFYFMSKSGVHHPSTDKKASISCRLHSVHGWNCKVTTSPLLSTE